MSGLAISSGMAGKLMLFEDTIRAMSKDAPIQTVKRTFEVIEELRRSGEMGTTELAETLNLPTSTVSDHLQTLSSCGYVVKTDDAYKIGTRFLFLGDRIRRQRQIFRSAEEELKNLAEETGEHASLTVEEEGLGVILHHVRGEKALEFNAYPGMRTHLHLSAAGKAILATLPDERVEEIVDNHGLPTVTANSIESPTELYEELDHVREQEYALDREESIEGMRGIGVPILDRHDAVLGAISLYGPRSRIAEERFTDELPEKLHESANVIEVDYNYNREGGDR